MSGEVKYEPDLIDAIKENIRTANTIYATQLCINLQKMGHNHTELEIYRAVVNTDLVNSVRFEKDVQSKKMVYSWKDKLQILVDKMNLSPTESQIFKRIHDAQTKGTKSTWLQSEFELTSKEVKGSLNRMLNMGIIAKTKVGKKIIFHRPDVKLDESITGGFFYDDLKPNHELIEYARRYSVECLAKKMETVDSQARTVGPRIGAKAACSVEEILKYLRDLNLFKGEIKVADITQVLDTLKYDDLINVVKDRKGEKMYYLVNNSYPEFFGLMHCPFAICEDAAENNPGIEEHFSSWLNQY